MGARPEIPSVLRAYRSQEEQLLLQLERASTVDPLFQNLKIRIHRKLIDTIDLTKLSTLETEMIKVEIRRILEEMVMTESLPLNRIDRERLVTEVQHEAFG